VFAEAETATLTETSTVPSDEDAPELDGGGQAGAARVADGSVRIAR